LQKHKDEIEEIEDRNDPPDKRNDIEDDENIDDEEEKSITNDNENQIPRTNLSIIDIQIFKNSVIVTRNLFLRKDNVAYFIDTNGKLLDAGSQKQTL